MGLLKSLFKNRAQTARHFVPRSPKKMMALNLSPGKQSDLNEEFPDLADIAETIGLHSTAAKKALDYWGKDEGWLDQLKFYIWLFTFLGASLINARVVQSSMPEGLEELGLNFIATFILSCGLNYLIDWLLAEEITELLLDAEAALVQVILPRGGGGILNRAYERGAEQAFQRVQRNHIKPKSAHPQNRSKLNLETLWHGLSPRVKVLIFMYGIEYLAALGIAFTVGEFQRQGLLMFFAPFVGIFLSSASGVFRANALEFPQVKHKMAGRYHDLALEAEDGGNLEQRHHYAEMVTAQFVQNPNLTREDFAQQQQYHDAAEQQRDFEVEVQEYQKTYSEQAIAQDRDYQAELTAKDSEEQEPNSSQRRQQALQLEINLIHRRYHRNRLQLIQRTLEDLAILKSNHGFESAVYEGFRAIVSQQEQFHQERLAVLMKEHQALNHPSSAKNNITLFPLEGDDRESA